MYNRSFKLIKKRYAQDSANYLFQNATELLPLLSDMEKIMEVSVLKTTAQLIDPVLYPMPSAEIPSLENIILPQLLSLPQYKKEIAISNFHSRINKIRLLTEIDNSNAYQPQLAESLQLPVSILDSSKELIFLKCAGIYSHLQTQNNEHGSVPNTMSSSGGGMKVNLRIHKIRCEEETTAISGDDEISIAATITNPDGSTGKIDPILVRDDFDTGEEQVYQPAWKFVTYNLWNGNDVGTFPKYCSCLLILSEIDNGGLSDKVGEIYNILQDALVAAIGRYGGGLITSTALAGPIGIVMGIAVAYLLDKLFDLFKEIWEDDLFAPILIDQVFRDQYSNFDGSMFSTLYSCVFKGFGGSYIIDYSWQMEGVLFTPPSFTGEGWTPQTETLPGIIIYKNTYYDGDSKLLVPGKYSLGGEGNGRIYRIPSPFNNEIDSIEVGKGYFATLFKTEDFTGESLELYQDTPTPYFDDQWRDQISSIIVGKLTDRIG